MEYKLLGKNDTIQEDDEYLDDDCIRWHNVKTAIVTKALIGQPYNPWFLVPLRRPTPPPNKANEADL